MKSFKSAKSTQRFLSTHSAVYNILNIQRHLISRRTLRQLHSVNASSAAMTGTMTASARFGHSWAYWIGLDAERSIKISAATPKTRVAKVNPRT